MKLSPQMLLEECRERGIDVWIDAVTGAIKCKSPAGLLVQGGQLTAIGIVLRNRKEELRPMLETRRTTTAEPAHNLGPPTASLAVTGPGRCLDFVKSNAIPDWATHYETGVGPTEIPPAWRDQKNWAGNVYVNGVH